VFSLDVDMIRTDFCVSGHEWLAIETISHPCWVYEDFDALAVAVIA
jgi:hypothetical protein